MVDISHHHKYKIYIIRSIPHLKLLYFTPERLSHSSKLRFDLKEFFLSTSVSSTMSSHHLPSVNQLSLL